MMDRSNLLPTLYEQMLLIRTVEERLAQLFADSELPGFIHLSIGQEAVAAGIASALSPQDTLASNHRGHGHSLAKGVDVDRFFLELFARDEGMCRGRGGSMHVADFSIGMLGANGIVGAGLPLALGSALAHQTLGRSAVSVAFFGDGAVAEGVLHECLNMAALWKLPMLFVCENNGWAEFSPSSRQIATTLLKLASAFGIECNRVYGNDVEAVAGIAHDYVAAIKAGGGPRAIECTTTRWRGHFEGDPQKYRSDAEKAAIGSDDPIVRAERKLLATGSAALIADAKSRVAARVDAAVTQARKGAKPGLADAMRDVYATAGAA